MKIMSGLDKDYSGEAWAAKDITVGYLPQEPVLDEAKTVRENVLDSPAVMPTTASLNPEITCVPPTSNVMGSPRFLELSNSVPSDSVPL